MHNGTHETRAARSRTIKGPADGFVTKHPSQPLGRCLAWRAQLETTEGVWVKRVVMSSVGQVRS